MSPCKTCPFRKKGFLRLRVKDAEALIDFVQNGDVALCHSAGHPRTHQVHCRGAQMFRDHPRDARIFRSEQEMLAAHKASTTTKVGELVDI